MKYRVYDREEIEMIYGSTRLFMDFSGFVMARLDDGGKTKKGAITWKNF